MLFKLFETNLNYPNWHNFTRVGLKAIRKARGAQSQEQQTIVNVGRLTLNRVRIFLRLAGLQTIPSPHDHSVHSSESVINLKEKVASIDELLASTLAPVIIVGQLYSLCVAVFVPKAFLHEILPRIIGPVPCLPTG